MQRLLCLRIHVLDGLSLDARTASCLLSALAKFCRFEFAAVPDIPHGASDHDMQYAIISIGALTFFQYDNYGKFANPVAAEKLVCALMWQQQINNAQPLHAKLCRISMGMASFMMASALHSEMTL